MLKFLWSCNLPTIYITQIMKVERNQGQRVRGIDLDATLSSHMHMHDLSTL